MTILKDATLSVATLGMIAAPVAAQAGVERSSVPVDAESEMGGSGMILAILAAVAIIAAIVIAADGSDDPVSA